jgi:hypothetical protein
VRVPVLWPVAATLAAALPAWADDVPIAARLEAVAPSIVVVRGVLETRWSNGQAGEEDESAIDERGAIVDSRGIVMVQGSSVGGDSAALRRWREQNPGSTYESTPGRLEVLVAPEMKEHRAVVLLQDSRLDVAFLLVLGLEGKTLPHVDLAVEGPIRLGDTLVGVTRRARGFDYAPEAKTLYAASRIEKPRVMWAIAGDFAGIGLPVFDLSGKAVGVTLSQETSEESAEDSEQETFLLPLESVRKSLDAARKRMPEVLAKESAREAAASKAESVPACPPAAPKDCPPAAPKGSTPECPPPDAGAR